MGIEDFLGPMCIGTVFNTFLLAFSFVQTYRFYIARRPDPLWIKVMVAGILLLDLLNSVCNFTYLYYFTVKSFANVGAVRVGTWTFNTGPITTSIISGTTQFFFGWRVQRFTGWKWVGYIISTLAVTSALAGVGMSIGCIMLPYIDNSSRLVSIVCVWMVSSAVADIMITASLILYLRNRQQDTWNKSTNDLISHVITLSMRTCAVVTLCSLMIIALFAAVKLRHINSNLYLIFLIPFGKLYSNSLLSSLNNRIKPIHRNPPTEPTVSTMLFDISPEGGHSFTHFDHKIRLGLLPPQSITTDRSHSETHGHTTYHVSRPYVPGLPPPPKSPLPHPEPMGRRSTSW